MAFGKEFQCQPNNWGEALDARGKYIWVQGTSFASPAVAGVVALMQGESKRQLNRERLTAVLKKTASHKGLTVSEEELKLHRLLLKRGMLSSKVSLGQYFFGSGLVNAEAAIREVKKLK